MVAPLAGTIVKDKHPNVQVNVWNVVVTNVSEDNPGQGQRAWFTVDQAIEALDWCQWQRLALENAFQVGQTKPEEEEEVGDAQGGYFHGSGHQEFGAFAGVPQGGAAVGGVEAGQTFDGNAADTSADLQGLVDAAIRNENKLLRQLVQQLREEQGTGHATWEGEVDMLQSQVKTAQTRLRELLGPGVSQTVLAEAWRQRTAAMAAVAVGSRPPLDPLSRRRLPLDVSVEATYMKPADRAALWYPKTHDAIHSGSDVSQAQATLLQRSSPRH